MAACNIRDKLSKETEKRLLADLNSARESYLWFFENKENLKKDFENQLVAVYECKVVDNALISTQKDLVDFFERVRKKYPENRVAYNYVKDYNLLLSTCA
jgi:hypothetical protein